MDHIRLLHGEWDYDPNTPLAPPGGFGQVFEGIGEKHGKVAVKRIKESAAKAAHRELRLAEELAGRALTHVIPIFDSGWDPESQFYFVIMPRAEKSLQDEVNSGHLWSDQEATSILLQIVKGLDEVADIVHRDLKPANVLFHEGRWKLADFGIARFVEDSTSLRTLKGARSKEYAAPEQWRMERATSATDLYALGCIACVLLTGKPPFPGPDMSDYREQHLSSLPPSLDDHLPSMCLLVLMLLRKDPQRRPSRDRVIKMLEDILVFHEHSARRDFATRLSRIAATVERETVVRESKEQDQSLKNIKRTRLMQEAQKALKEIIAKTLVQRILDAAPNALHRSSAHPDSSWSVEVTLGKSKFSSHSKSIGYHGYLLRKFLWEGACPSSPWDIVAEAEIAVGGWSASLWCGNTDKWKDYRWFEVAFFKKHTTDPHRQGPYSGESVLADIHIDEDSFNHLNLDGIGIAYSPRPIDDEDAERFCRRWIALFAKAAAGDLQPPSSWPIPDSFLEELEA